MGRELRRKQAKKEGKSLEKEEIIEEKHLKRYLINVIIIILVIVIIYLLSALFITKELDWFNKKETKENTETKTSDDILASEVFKQSEEEYYVYFYDFNEKESIVTDTVLSRLAYSKVYKVNTTAVMNANYVSETGNKKAKNLSELKVVSPTLIKISNGTITEYYEKQEITNKLS